MPHFDLYTLLKWLHIISLALGGGSAMVILVLVGLEESREDLRGLTSLLWKRTTCWAFRFAFLMGIVLLVLKIRTGEPVWDYVYLHAKLPLVVLLLALSEMTPRALATRKRGAPLLVFLFFLLATFVSVNSSAFPVRKGRTIERSYTGTVEPGR